MNVIFLPISLFAAFICVKAQQTGLIANTEGRKTKKPPWTLHVNRYVKVINHENRSAEVSGSFVFGIGVGEKPTIVGGIYSTL